MESLCRRQLFQKRQIFPGLLYSIRESRLTNRVPSLTDFRVLYTRENFAQTDFLERPSQSQNPIKKNRRRVVDTSRTIAKEMIATNSLLVNVKMAKMRI